MAQEIKIPVSAQTGGAEKAVDQLADAFGGVADQVGAIDKKARAASTSIKRLADDLRQVKAAQAFLSKSLGRSVSDTDTKAFLGNFQAAGQRGPASRGIRAFGGDFIDWSQGHSTMYRGRAAAHRSMVLGMGMSGTDYAGQFGTPGPGFGGGGGGAPSGGGSSFGAAVEKSKSAAMGFGKSMLALAGVTSVMGMASRAVDMATEEAIGVDNFKRRLGDLGVDFDRLRDQARGAGNGLGVTWVESVRLGQAYASQVGNLGAKDALNVSGSLRVGMGLSRAYGMDLEAGNSFVGSMAKYGVARDETGQRRLALMIGDAVARSGYSGKVDELLSAVSDYTATNSRATLSATNVGGFTSAITSLMRKGYPGMGPNEAGAMLGQADSAVRRGGNMGEASQNFLYNALRNFSPGMTPGQGMAMMQGGLFATGDSVFGSGPLKGLGPGGKMTTFEKVMKTIGPRYKDKLMRDMALSGLFGTTIAQSGALADMSVNGQVGQSAALLEGSGVKLEQVSATSMPMIAKLAMAKGRKGIMGVGNLVNSRTDLSPEIHQKLNDAMAGGSDEDVRKGLAHVIATLDQEETEGQKTRQSMTDFQNTLTRVGKDLLEPLNLIRNAVVALAGFTVPGFTMQAGGTPIGANGWSGSKGGFFGMTKEQAKASQSHDMEWYMKHGQSRLQAAGWVGAITAESGGNPLALGDKDKATGLYTARGKFQMHADRWNAYTAWAKSKGLDPDDTDAQNAYSLVEGPEIASRNLMKNARSIKDATNAGVRYERPQGFHTQMEDYSNANNYGGRLAATQSAYDVGAAIEHNLTVKLVDPNGKTATTKIPLVPKPSPAGSKVHAAPAANYMTDFNSAASFE